MTAMEEDIKLKRDDNYGLQRSGLKLNDEVGELVMPGDEFLIPDEESDKKLIIGPGLKMISGPNVRERIAACRAGILTRAKPFTYFVQMKSQQYDRYKKDDVVAIIKQRSKPDYYTCDVGTRDKARLSKFAFEGATKRYKPELQVGDCVYAKVVDLPKDFPMEISCVSATTGKSMGMGLMTGGHVIQVPTYFIRFLRTPNKRENLMYQIGEIIPFEMSAGTNGLVWIKAQIPEMTVLIAQLIEALAKRKPSEYSDLIDKFRTAVSSL